MKTEDKVRALQMVCQVYRFTMPSDPFWFGSSARLAKRFNEILLGADLSALTQEYAIAAASDSTGSAATLQRLALRACRIDLASQLVGRRINSFNDLFGGELKAILDEQDLTEIVLYLLGVKHRE